MRKQEEEGEMRNGSEEGDLCVCACGVSRARSGEEARRGGGEGLRRKKTREEGETKEAQQQQQQQHREIHAEEGQQHTNNKKESPPQHMGIGLLVAVLLENFKGGYICVVGFACGPMGLLRRVKRIQLQVRVLYVPYI